MKNYDFKKIEKKWQKTWAQKKVFAAANKTSKPSWYTLVEFPYPSGAGMHVGHVRSYTALDVVSRKRRMEGYNVLYPMGWDAFGLPTENYAIKTGVAPQVATKKNTDNFRKQLQSLGFSFDWAREVNTTDPNYYKWTQWIFQQFFKQGLAYKAKMAINWCPKDKIGLANEEVVGGKCERCGTAVEQRQKEQWMLKITAYADKLLAGLKDLDYLPEIKAQQENWIGRSEGAEIDFALTTGQKVKVFTTRADTLFGATYLVLAPEHSLVTELQARITNWSDVQQYISATKLKGDLERTEGKEKTGIELKGIKAINPATKEEIPVWISDYVLASYGTGAIMAVPAHDERDFAFAKKFGLPIKKVVVQTMLHGHVPTGERDVMKYVKGQLFENESVYAGNGLLFNSGKFNGMETEAAKKAITEFVGGKTTVKYKLRDWVFSRQRYWGEPIPLINCEACGWVCVPEKNLPVTLPKVKKYEPTDTGESPLSLMPKWVKTKCPQCKGPATRETDTMPNWAGSSWYFLAYLMSQKAFKGKVSRAMWDAQLPAFKSFMPVNWYNGGMEHVTLHLLYSRFWNIFLYDQGLVAAPEPYKKRTAHGMILAADGKKMSKSLGNVVNPDDLVKEFGADALRLYELFIGPFDQAVAWDTRGILGTSRFLEKIWRTSASLQEASVATTDQKLAVLLAKTIKKVGEDIEAASFNTAVSAMMIFVNALGEKTAITTADWQRFLIILSPFAPHLAEELWTAAKGKGFIALQPWPTFDAALLVDKQVTIIVQVNSKVRGTMQLEKGVSQAQAATAALSLPEVKKWIVGEPKRVIYVPDRLLNFIV
jgi:leucyl-tRNA synthetase